MIDKEQIIVNGVDVSKCFHYEKENKEYTCRLNHTPFHYRHCEENPNCYFKQLARKTQECEELKRKIFEFEKAGGIIDEGIAWKGQADCYRKALEEIEEYLDAQQKYFDGEDYHNLLDIINKAKGEL